ncbi:hypothetical protein [Chitinophaga sp. YIM B06452]|uniref:hypothetical protein n=1 Tax=Chitinophaga sp. YIM B06452 TaxID=3082158 RepID=UPI0031FE8919
MTNSKFSEEQISVIEQLTALLKQCQQLNIHISGVSDYEVKQYEDGNGNDYLAIT